MPQYTVTDPHSGAARQVDVGPVNDLALSNQPVDAALTPVASHALDPAPVPSHVPNAPMPFVRAPSAGEQLKGIGQTAVDWVAQQPLAQAGEALLGSFSPIAQARDAYREPGGLEKLSYDPGMYMGTGALEPPLKGFYSRFTSEVVPRLSAKPQHAQKVQNLVDRFMPKEEWEWMGGPAWVKAQGNAPVTKAQAEDFFARNMLKIGEHVRGGEKTEHEVRALSDAAHEAGDALAEAVRTAQRTLPENLHDDLDRAAEHGELVGNTDLAPEVHHLAALRRAYVAARDAWRGRQEAEARLGPRYVQHTLPGGREFAADYREQLLTTTPKTAPGVMPEVTWAPPRAESLSSGPFRVHLASGPGYDNAIEVRDYTGHTLGKEGKQFWVHAPYSTTPEWYPDLSSAQTEALRRVREDVEATAKIQAQFTHSHFGDTPNYFAHARTTERDLPGVGKTLVAEEIQSDLHQVGSKVGYRQPGDRVRAKIASGAAERAYHERMTEFRAATGKPFLQQPLLDALALEGQHTPELIHGLLQDAVGKREINRLPQEPLRRIIEADHARAAANYAQMRAQQAPPDFPFKAKWQELSLRVLLRDAVARGAEAIGWTSGAQQMTRWSQALKDVGKLRILTNDRGVHLTAYDRHGSAVISKVLDHGEQLPDWIGVTNAKRLWAAPPTYRDNTIAREVALGPDERFQVGGKGLAREYDEVLPGIANRIGKAHGAQAERVPFTQRVPKPTPLRGEENPWMDREGHVWEEPPDEWEREDFDEPEPDNPDDDDSFEPDYSAYQHSVEVDDLENNAAELNDRLDDVRRRYPQLFGPDPRQPALFEGAPADPGAPRRGVRFEARPGEGFEYGNAIEGPTVVAIYEDGTEVDINFIDNEFADVDDAEAFVDHLNAGDNNIEPTQWRYTYNEGGHGSLDETSEWFDSAELATRAAEDKQQELDDAAYEDQANEWYREARHTYRAWARDHAAHEAAQDQIEQHLTAARARWEAQGSVPPGDIASDADAHFNLVSHGDLWVLRIPPAWAKEIREKGQALPQVALPLTGAGLTLMASHKRDR